MAPRVMVVDDDEAGATVVRMQLQQEGVEATVALGGRQALELLCEATCAGKTFDLMLLDIAMPDVNGWEVLRAVKCNPLWADMRVIVLTGYATTPDDMARVAGYDGVQIGRAHV
jgi:CheY-like chemotaxis protein